MEIVNHRQKNVGCDVKENDNFVTKVISTENVEKRVVKVRRKNQTCFFSKLLGD